MTSRRWMWGFALVIAVSGDDQASTVSLDEGRSRVPACVALMLPSVTGAEGDATAIANAVRDLFVSYLKGPWLRTVLLDARLPAMAVAEAGQKDCNRVLIVKVVYKRGGGGRLGRALGEAAQTAAWHAPVGSASGAVARGAAATGGQAIVALSQSTKAKDQVRLEYTVVPSDAQPGTGAALVIDAAKAKRDGEDVLTPLVERTAQAVVAIVVNR